MSPRKAHRALAALSANASPTRDVFITRAESSVHGVSLHIVSAPDSVRGVIDPEKESAEVLDALYELPVETRRALFIKLSEFSDGFCNSPARRTKNWSKHERRSR